MGHLVGLQLAGRVPALDLDICLLAIHYTVSLFYLHICTCVIKNNTNKK